MTIKRLKGKTFAKHAVLIIVSLISLFPFYWIVVSSTNTSLDIMQARLLPGNFFSENFKNLTQDGKMWNAFANSLRNATVITVLSLLVSSAAGYGFVLYSDRKKDLLLKLLLLSMMIPAAATLIPLFKMFSKMSLVNNLMGVILPSISTAFLIFMFRQGALGFPRDLVEAARIDGMGEARIFVRVFMPVMKPTYAAAATVTFMNSWNAYLWPLVILQSENSRTMPIYTFNLMVGYVVDYGKVMLAVAISTLPTIVVFFLLQKNFVNGILGSIKQ